MNERQQKYKLNRLAGMNIYNSARAAGYSENYSRNARPEKVAKVCLSEAFEQAGLTDKAIVIHALSGLQANKVISCNVIAPNGEGMADAHGTTKDFIDVPDWNARHKYFNTICELTGRITKNINQFNDNREVKILIVRADKQEVIENPLIQKTNGREILVDA